MQSIAYSSVIAPNSPKINFKVSGEAVIAGPKSLKRSDFFIVTGGGRSIAGGY